MKIRQMKARIDKKVALDKISQRTCDACYKYDRARRADLIPPPRARLNPYWTWAIGYAQRRQAVERKLGLNYAETPVVDVQMDWSLYEIDVVVTGAAAYRSLMAPLGQLFVDKHYLQCARLRLCRMIDHCDQHPIHPRQMLHVLLGALYQSPGTPVQQRHEIMRLLIAPRANLREMCDSLNGHATAWSPEKLR